MYKVFPVLHSVVLVARSLKIIIMGLVLSYFIIMSCFDVEIFYNPPTLYFKENNAYSIFCFCYSLLMGLFHPFFLSRPPNSMPQITNINFPLSLINCLLSYSGISSTWIIKNFLTISSLCLISSNTLIIKCVHNYSSTLIILLAYCIWLYWFMVSS